MAITPKGWDNFQHYKDRSPPWIKLHRGLLDNVDYYRLSAEAAKALPLIWLIASERDGVIPAGAELAFRLRLDDDLSNDILAELLKSGFLVEKGIETAEQVATLAQRTAKSNGFGSRHISDLTKREVWERDGGKCVQCDSEKNIEYDHKHPVSKGGNSEAENIQLLCRPCNRSKRTKVATQPLSRRSLEGEAERQDQNIEKTEQKVARTDLQKRIGDFRQAIVQAYAEANSPTLPDTSRAELWITQGYQEDICLAVIAGIVRKKPNVSLSYFDSPIAEAHTKKAPPRKAIGGPPPIDWDMVLTSYKKFGRWSRDAGNDPSSPGCRAPHEILRKYGFEPVGVTS